MSGKLPRSADKSHVVRLPVVGTYNSRTIGATTLNSASGIVGIGVVGTMIVGSTSSSNRDQKYINAIPEKITNPLTGKDTFYCYKRPGFASHSTPASGSNGTAIRVWTGQGNGDKVISAFGLTNSTIYDGTSSIGTITGVVTSITETLLAGTANLVIAVDNNKGYYYPTGGAMTEITDVDYPGNASRTTTGAFAHLDGYTFIMDTTGRIYNSDLNSISAWSADSYINSDMYPDKGVGLARYKDMIVGFGRESIEFFRDVGGATKVTPLARVNEAFIKIGAMGPEAITELEDTIAWVSSSNIGSISVYVLDGYKAKKISTETIDSQLNLRGSATIYLSSAKLFGKTLIFVQLPGQTFVYSMEDDMWHEWSGQVRYWHKFAANTAATPVVYSITRDDTSGKVFKLNPVSPVFTDNGNTYTMTVQTSKFDMDKERRKFLSKLAIIGDISTSSSTFNVSWSDDDYVTFSTARTLDISNNRNYLTNCGSFRRRAFKLTNSSAYPVRLEALELEVSEGLH